MARCLTDCLEAAALALGFDYWQAKFMPGSVAVAGTTNEIAHVLAPYMQVDEQETLRLVDAMSNQAPMVPAVDLAFCLGRLRQEFVLGLVTNDSEARSRSQLHAADIVDCFAFIAGCDSGYGAKPAPDPLLAFAKATSIAPERTLMVGDSRVDLVAAKAAGMRPIAVLTGVAGRKSWRAMRRLCFPTSDSLPTGSPTDSQATRKTTRGVGNGHSTCHASTKTLDKSGDCNVRSRAKAPRRRTGGKPRQEIGRTFSANALAHSCQSGCTHRTTG